MDVGDRPYKKTSFVQTGIERPYKCPKCGYGKVSWCGGGQWSPPGQDAHEIRVCRKCGLHFLVISKYCGWKVITGDEVQRLKHEWNILR